MPTKHRRHAITETPPVRAALDELRHELGQQRLDLAEVMILGAREKVAQLRRADERRMNSRRWLADRIRAGDSMVDPQAAEEVRRTGWVRP